MNNPHPLWSYLPVERRTKRCLWNLRFRRIWAWLKGRNQRIIVFTIAYLITWSLPVLLGQALISFFALLPVLLVPPVGFLVYWLVWKEFHD